MPDLAFNADRHLAAWRSHSSDSWWVFPIPPTSDLGYQSDLPDLPGEGWTRLFPATERDLADETLELAWLARHLGKPEVPDA